MFATLVMQLPAHHVGGALEAGAYTRPLFIST